jgi:cation diffusion facilitator family transporter
MGSGEGASGDVQQLDDATSVSVSSRAPTEEHEESFASSFEFKWTLRKLALELSLYLNLFITAVKFVAYIRTMSLSVLAALLDSVLDVVSQVVLNYTEKHSSLQRSSAFYPAGASRLEPIGVLTCAALMGMASFEVLKESFTTLIYQDDTMQDLSLQQEIFSFWSMVAVVVVKLLLLLLCQKASNRRTTGWDNINGKAALQLADPTLEALSQDHYNDVLSNGVAAVALILSLYSPNLWFLDPFGAILISLYIIYSWYHTGKEQIEQLTGKSAPDDFIDTLLELAEHFDERMLVDTCRAYHFGPKFLVELEVVLPKHTLLVESHDLGMELQYEIEGREEVERCFVHIDYETRDYDEHVVSKVPELREQLLRNRNRKLLKSHASV